MTDPTDTARPDQPFLNVKDAEVVDGPTSIAEKVSDALRDADRFGLHRVKPPLSEALAKVQASGDTDEAEAGGHNALTGETAEVNENAGVLKPGAEGDQG